MHKIFNLDEIMNDEDKKEWVRNDFELEEKNAYLSN